MSAALRIELSKRLTKVLGRGYSRSNLYNMREIYMQYPKIQMASGKLSCLFYKYEQNRSFKLDFASIDKITENVKTMALRRFK
jgi:hypothetical protein